jgi:hypothetical protein
LKKSIMHISEAEIILFFERKLPDERRARVLLHLSDCDACSAQLAAISRLTDLLSDGTVRDVDPGVLARARNIAGTEKTPRGVHRGRLSPARWLTLAGIAAACALVIIVLTSPERIEPDRFRASSAPNPVAPPSLLTGREVSIGRRLFTWTSVPGAAGYRFHLYESDGAAIVSVSGRDTVYTVDQSVALITGRTYLWSVEAVFPDETIARSQPNVVSFSPPP